MRCLPCTTRSTRPGFRRHRRIRSPGRRPRRPAPRSSARPKFFLPAPTIPPPRKPTFTDRAMVHRAETDSRRLARASSRSLAPSELSSLARPGKRQADRPRAHGRLQSDGHSGRAGRSDNSSGIYAHAGPQTGRRHLRCQRDYWRLFFCCWKANSDLASPLTQRWISTANRDCAVYRRSIDGCRISSPCTM